MTISATPLLPPDGRAAVMGILNITPDSFSDGGLLYKDDRPHVETILSLAENMISAGVDILDIGGESTRPGARPVSTNEELSRVVPVVKLLKQNFPVALSVDTSNPEVMIAAAGEGVDLINDVRALTKPGALEAVSSTHLPVCLMHMPAEPDVMQDNPQYHDVVSEVMCFLKSRVESCQKAGIQADRIWLDPGFGFGKTLEHNLSLFSHLSELADMGFPLLVGVSRKRMIAALLKSDSCDRVIGSVALALLAVQRGAKIVRVHDVPETVAALRIMNAIEGA